VEQVRKCRVLTLEKSNLQLGQKPGRCQPEIVPYQDEALDPTAVTLAQGLHQFRIVFLPFGVKPLLELVEDDQDFLARRNAFPTAQCGQGFCETQMNRQWWAAFAEAMEQARLRLSTR